MTAESASLEFRHQAVAGLVPDPHNARTRPKRQLDQIAASIREFGFVNPILVDPEGRIIAGHVRNGVPRELTVEKALQHQTYRDAIAGNRPARREILKMIAKREKAIAAREGRRTPKVDVLQEASDPENADQALLILGIACRDPDRQGPGLDGEQMLLEPWAVQLALSRRRGGSKLTEEVADIRRSTRQSGTIRWPRGNRDE